MKDLITIMLNGAFDNIKRILFASDRVTDMEMRNAILNGEVKPTRKVNEELCIGCSGCANICPTGSITMKPLQKPVKITENWVKKEVPEFNEGFLKLTAVMSMLTPMVSNGCSPIFWTML